MDSPDKVAQLHQKAQLWERWESGQCVADTARALGRESVIGMSARILLLMMAALHHYNGGGLWRHSGLRSARKSLRGIASGLSLPRRSPAALGGRHRRVSREIRRERRQPNLPCKPSRGARLEYGITRPNHVAWHVVLPLRWRVAHKLALQWSPAANRRLAKAAVPDRVRTCSYLTKRSIAASSFRRVAC